MIVVDASVLAHFILPSAHTADVQAVYERDPVWMAPVLWQSEMRSVLRKYLLATSLSLEEALQAAGFARQIMNGGTGVVPDEDVLQACMESRCSSYDAEYITMARSLATVVVTYDRAMLTSFPDVAVSVREFT